MPSVYIWAYFYTSTFSIIYFYTNSTNADCTLRNIDYCYVTRDIKGTRQVPECLCAQGIVHCTFLCYSFHVTLKSVMLITMDIQL